MITTTGIGFSVIAPPVYLEHFVAQEPPRVHHVAAQHVLSDEIYRAFFAREAERGAEIVVDNGLFDLGYALPQKASSKPRSRCPRGRSSCRTSCGTGPRP